MPNHLAICWHFKPRQLYCCLGFKCWQLPKPTAFAKLTTNLSVRVELLTANLWKFADSSTERFISGDGDKRDCSLGFPSYPSLLFPLHGQNNLSPPQGNFSTNLFRRLDSIVISPTMAMMLWLLARSLSPHCSSPEFRHRRSLPISCRSDEP